MADFDETGTSSNNKRIAKNTIMLYIRMLITMIVGLYTSRVILSTLGLSDYGLYSVVGGFVTMLSFLNGTMANGTQRFLSFTIGQNNLDKLKMVFSNSLIIHLVIALIVIVISETIALWFLNTQMAIPEGREGAAFWVFQLSIFTFIVSIIQVPFMSSLIAHEKMDIYAYMSIYDVVMKLIIVYMLQVVPGDKLILYAILYALIQLSDAGLYMLYCHRKYSECRLRLKYDKAICKEMMGFSIWTMIGALGYTTNGQGVNILLNMFYGTIVNAARGIAFQVNGIIVGFSRNFQTASNPQIIKYYAEGKIEEMTKLVLRTSRFSGYLVIFLMLPFFMEVEYLLKIWLGEYPEHTPTFLRIILIQSLIQTLSGPIVTVTHAGGKLKMPNLTGGICILSALPICYIALKQGATPEQVFIINLVPWFFEGFFDSYYGQKYTGFSQKKFYKEVYAKVTLVLLVSLACLKAFVTIIPFDGFLRFIVVGFLCVIIGGLSIYWLGLYSTERYLLKKKCYR